MPSKKQRQGEEPSLLELAFCAIRPEDNPFMAQEPAQQKRRPSKRSLKRKAEREKDRVAAKYLDHDIEYGEDDTIGSPESRAAGAGRCTVADHNKLEHSPDLLRFLLLRTSPSARFGGYCSTFL